MIHDHNSKDTPPPEQKRRFHIGMRNVKTSLSVLFCVLLYHFIGRDGTALACTSAIICMQESIEKSVDSGRNRLIGTAFGALLGMLLLYVNLYFAPVVNLSLVTATVGTMLFILLCNVIDKPDAIVIGCVVLLTIVLQQNEASPFLYSVDRLVDTFVGIFVSIIINALIRNPVRLEAGEGETPPQCQPPLPQETESEELEEPIETPPAPEDSGESGSDDNHTKLEGMD